MKKDEIDKQKIIVNKFEEEIAKSIKSIINLGNNKYLILTTQEYPNNLYLAEYHEGEEKPSLLKGEKQGPAFVVRGLINIEAHQDIDLGRVEQKKWQ